MTTKSSQWWFSSAVLELIFFATIRSGSVMAPSNQPQTLLTGKIKMKNCSKSKYILLFKVYNILAKPESAGGAGIPCDALLPKEMATYLKMFSIIKENLGDCSKLSTIISDFERAVFEAVYHVYPSTGQSGCWFHFNSAVWKNIGEKGLQSLFFYQNPSYQEVF